MELDSRVELAVVVPLRLAVGRPVFCPWRPLQASPAQAPTPGPAKLFVLDQRVDARPGCRCSGFEEHDIYLR